MSDNWKKTFALMEGLGWVKREGTLGHTKGDVQINMWHIEGTGWFFDKYKKVPKIETLVSYDNLSFEVFFDKLNEAVK